MMEPRTSTTKNQTYNFIERSGEQEQYRGNYEKCRNRKSLHSKWRNRIDGAKEKTKTVKRSNEWPEIESDNQEASDCEKYNQNPC